MRRPNVLRPTVELFSEGEVLDSIALYRHGAFARPSYFPLRRLKTFPDHVELSWPNKNKPPQIILLQWRPLHFGGAFPYFSCYKCGCRVRKLYVTSIDVACRRCSELQWKCQRQFWTTRLKARADKIRNRLWTEGEKIIRPRLMRQRTFRKHLNKLRMIEYALATGSHIRWIRSRDHLRPRDSDGRYCD